MERGRNLTKERELECEGANVTLAILFHPGKLCFVCFTSDLFHPGNLVTVFEQAIKTNRTRQTTCDPNQDRLTSAGDKDDNMYGDKDGDKDAACSTKTLFRVVRDDLWLKVAVFGALTVVSLSTLIILILVCKSIRRGKKLI